MSEAIDVEQFNKDMLALLNGEREELRCSTSRPGRENKGDFLQLGKEDILVIEGIHGLNDKLSYALPEGEQVQNLYQCPHPAEH